MTHTLEVHRFQPADIRLGRHVHHDSRSLNYLFLPRDAKPKKVSSFFDSGTGPLNQGQVGSCTGNATAGFLNTHFSDLTRKAVRKAGGYFVEADAVKIYSLGTTLDSEPGSYPPKDTGCDGVSVAKAATKLGWLNKYEHLVSFSSAQAAAEITPAIQGTVWTKSMFTPVNGLVTVGKITDATVEGGHEYLLCGIDWKNEVFIHRNSWGDQDAWPGCKPGGYFAISFKDEQALYANQGDLTVLHGVAQAA